MHLPRSDQRRWGEIYIRGLVSVPGRKSIRRMSDYIVGGRADQGIQQFVNQSPWEWAPVRRSLANHVLSLSKPDAWVVDEVVIPKNGTNSVGVARQYAPSAGRVLNCQLGLGIFLSSDELTSPVNWRLMLPPSWDGDAARRNRAHVPDNERYRTRWQYLIDALDEMTFEWELPPMPIVVDSRHDTSVEPLLRALEERGHRYLVRIASGTPMSLGTTACRTDTITASELATLVNRNGSTSLSWRNDDCTASRFVVQPLHRGGHGRHRPRHLLAEWLPGQQRPNGIWLTNLTSVRLPQLIDLARTPRRTRAELSDLRQELGLCHFEGRSFRGWHHHLTLVSLAHAYVRGRDLAERDEQLRLRASYA
ncbi:IS701 family transposase [Micromonospora sp. NPDC048935]|uniref:IS701 family transposase n=1 Tax=Micromonospora sp. NPDC048935 TaxID=3364262 RepID=UPI00371133BB